MPKIETYTVRKYLKRLYFRDAKTGKFAKQNGRKSQYLVWEDYDGNSFAVFLRAGKHNSRLRKQIIEKLKKLKNFKKIKELFGLYVIKKLRKIPKKKKVKISFPKIEPRKDRYGNDRITYLFEFLFDWENIDDDAKRIFDEIQEFIEKLLLKSCIKLDKLGFDYYSIIIKLTAKEKQIEFPLYVSGDIVTVKGEKREFAKEVSKHKTEFIVKRIREILKDYNIKLNRLLVFISFVKELQNESTKKFENK